MNIAPPSHPLYPEPQPLGCSRYILDPETYATHLPRKFHSVSHDTEALGELEAVIVHFDGALKVEHRENMFIHSSQWTHFNGRWEYEDDTNYLPDERAPKRQGKGRRWTYLPWTREQEESCEHTMVVKLKVSPKRKVGEDDGEDHEAGRVPKRQMIN